MIGTARNPTLEQDRDILENLSNPLDNCRHLQTIHDECISCGLKLQEWQEHHGHNNNGDHVDRVIFH